MIPSTQRRSAQNTLRDRLAIGVAWGSGSVVTAAFACLLFDIVRQGAGQLSWSFLVDSTLDAGRRGGIGPVLISTLMILFVCISCALPLGFGAAAFLSELTRGDQLLACTVRRSLDILATVPSIVFGLFGNALFCITLNLGYSILSGGLTLSCMVLPMLIRVTEEGMRAVPEEYRQAAAALGLSRSTTLFRIVLPTASPALAAGLVLGIGRALAETAALIYTSGYVTRRPESLFDSGRALSVHIYDLSMNVPDGELRANATAMVLIVLLLLINGISRWLVGRMNTPSRSGVTL